MQPLKDTSLQTLAGVALGGVISQVMQAQDYVGAAILLALGALLLLYKYKTR